MRIFQVRKFPRQFIGISHRSVEDFRVYLGLFRNDVSQKNLYCITAVRASGNREREKPIAKRGRDRSDLPRSVSPRAKLTRCASTSVSVQHSVINSLVPLERFSDEMNICD
ncbi:unnamed protein product [Lasius platythorax]|uniref:Uncharacterized protein n=1 Tax=Lasius platythorax TaxID=488582 RepID=A0AAV2NQ85_9HYME